MVQPPGNSGNQQPSTSFEPQPVVNQQTRRGRSRRGRGRGRGGRGGNNRSIPPSLGSGGGLVVVQDVEYFKLTDINKIYVAEFNPSSAGLTRLKQFESMYERYRIVFFNFTFKPATSTYTSGSMTFGISPGPANGSVKDADTILKVRPSRMIPIYGKASVSLGQTIDSQRYMHCGDKTADGVAFTFYAYTDASAVYGAFQVSYKVEFAYPRPF